MLEELVMFAATEGVVLVTTALVFSGPDPIEEDEESAEAVAEKAETRGWQTSAPRPCTRLNGMSHSL